MKIRRVTRIALLDLLEALDPPTPASCLVLLWTFYNPHLGEVENGLRDAGNPPLWLQADPLGGTAPGSADLTARFRRLRSIVDDAPRFDQAALSLLKGLDRALHRGAAVASGVEHRGADGERYRLWPRNNFIADTYEARDDAASGAAHQGRSMATYARHFLVDPIGMPGELRVESRRLRAVDPYLDSRLRLERDNERLRVMLWPMAVRIDYPALDGLGAAPAFVSLNDPRNEGTLRIDVEEAIDEAGRREATVLILPELAISPVIVDAAQRKLARKASGGYPILTLLGLCHAHPSGSGPGTWPRLEVNEALLLGPDGSEVYRHRKTVPFSLGGEYPCGERIHTGDLVTVLESPMGNLSILICLDLFHERVRGVLVRSPANLLLVPSLSPSTSAHRTRATDLSASRLVSTFVANRWLDDATTEEARVKRASFYRVPRHQHGEVLHTAPASYLMFEL